MTEWLILFSNAAAGGVRAVVCLFLIYRLLSAQRSEGGGLTVQKPQGGGLTVQRPDGGGLTVQRPDRRSIAAALAGIVVLSMLVSVTGLPELYQMLLEAVLTAVCARRFQSADMRMSLFIGFFYAIAVHLWQFLFGAWLGVFFHAAVFLDNATGYGQAAVWLVHLLLVVLAAFALKYPNMTGKRAFGIISGLVVAGFMAVILLSEQTVLEVDSDTEYMWTILSVVLMMGVLVFNMNRQYVIEKEMARLKSQQAELLERDYTTLNKAYAFNAKLFHDFHNHIGALRQLLLHEKLEEAMQYLDELQTPVRGMANTVWTGDETVDYLINSKAVTAANHGIQYEVQVEFPRHTNLKSADLCTVLGNLLDNALEAAMQIPEPEQRFIHLTMRRINQMLIIKVENSFVAPPILKDGAPKTAKEENGLHGWGLKSAQTAAEKYDGMVQTSFTDSTFRAVATLSFESVSVEHTSS